MRHEDAAAEPRAYESECLRKLREHVGPRPLEPERDLLLLLGLTWRSVEYEGGFPDTIIVVTVEDLRRAPQVVEYRFAL